jgi:hypothetical protein
VYEVGGGCCDVGTVDCRIREAIIRLYICGVGKKRGGVEGNMFCLVFVEWPTTADQ